MSDRPSPLRLVQPVALLRLWGSDDLLAAFAAETTREPFAHLLAPGLAAILPAPGRPGALDRALALGQFVLAPRVDPRAPRGESHALLMPARLRTDGRPELVEDEITALVVRRSPKLPPDAVHATAHALHGFEGAYQARPAGTLPLPSGRVLPILAVGAPDPQATPWRNREVLGRALKWTERPELEVELGRHLRDQRVVRVVGPLGVGKTRLAAEMLKRQGLHAVWRNAELATRHLSTLAQELAGGATAAPWLVLDSLEAARPELWKEIAALAARPDLAALRWLLVGREPLAWPPELAAAPRVVVSELAGPALDAFSKQIFSGLNLPDDVAQKLHAAAGGNPFALEEGLIYLVRDRQVRQVFGSFFYRGGGDGGPTQPTPRLVLHLESELLRLGAATAARALALIDRPVPASEPHAAALAAGDDDAGRASWEAPYVAAGLLSRRQGPWGDGVVWTVPAFRQAVESTLEPPSRTVLAHFLGELLAARGGGAGQIWPAYPLVAGSPEGARTLLAIAASGSGGPSRETLFTAMLAESRALGAAGSATDDDLELELDWALLPLGRRLGRLHELEDRIARAATLAAKRPERLLAVVAVQAELAQKAGRLAEAEGVLHQALLAVRGNDDRRQGPLLLELARVMVRRGRLDDARELLQKTLAAAEHRQRKGLAASCRFQLGNLALAAYRLDEAQKLHEVALASRREGDLPVAATQSLTALGAVALLQGNYPVALARFTEARDLAVEHGFDREEAFGQLGVGRSLSRLGDETGASAALRRALSLREGRDDSVGEGIARLAVAENHLRLDQLELAQQEARKAHFALNLMPEGEARADAEQLLGRIAARQRRYADAVVHLAEAARLHRAALKGHAVLTDLGHALDLALAMEDPAAIERAFDALAAERENLPQVPSGEFFDFCLYQGARAIARGGGRAVESLPFLRRAYHELLRKTSFLEPARRQRFLFQIPEHQAIVDAATRERISLPAF